MATTVRCKINLSIHPRDGDQSVMNLPPTHIITALLLIMRIESKIKLCFSPQHQLVLSETHYCTIQANFYCAVAASLMWR